MAYIPEERETHISTCDVDKKWCVYTRQRKIINKLNRLGYEMFNVEMEGDVVIGAEFYLDLNKITFRKAKSETREYTEEEKEIIAQRLAASRINKQK